MTDTNMITIKKELEEYSIAFTEYLNAQKLETKSRIEVIKTRHKLLQARDILQGRERELLEEQHHHEKKD